MDYSESEYNELAMKYKILLSRYESIERELDKCNAENNKLCETINKELNPRIEKEKKQYDLWVENGGGDMCFQRGITGNCGENCPEYSENSSKCMGE